MRRRLQMQSMTQFVGIVSYQGSQLGTFAFLFYLSLIGGGVLVEYGGEDEGGVYDDLSCL